jgi:predicted TIM-barrel fold metal-dependent hydrolase
MAREYRVVSADGHLEIAPERWSGRVPRAYRDRAPRLVKLANGGDGVVIENRALYVLGLAITGKPYEEHTLTGITYEGSPGAGTPEQRVAEQDKDGVDAEVLYTSAGNGGFWRGIQEDAAFEAVIHAYNEFLAEEYCAAAPDRLLAMAVIPGTSLKNSIQELEYCKTHGIKGVALNSFPSGKSWPTPADDEFWQAAIDMQMPLTVHVGFIGRDGPVFKYARDPGVVAFGADPVRVLTRFTGGSGQLPIQIAMAGVFDRFPTLRLYIAETMLGWVPHFLFQVDDVWERSRHWAYRFYGLESPPRKLSEYIKDHIIWGFLRDPVGVRLRHDVGVENAMWGSDFPHSASDWPYSSRVIEECFEGVPEAERVAMTRDNAVKFFHLDNGN